MGDAAKHRDEAFRRFLRRVWREDVGPLLRDKHAGRRRKSARVTGKIAAVTGLAVDSLFHLRGKPFTRFMTVMGSSLGAMLPDVWDWKWFRSADEQTRRAATERFQAAAANLPEADALELFDLPPTASFDALKESWRTISKRWHPDKAPDEQRRVEYHLRFVAYQAAYERLCAAYRENRLPLAAPDGSGD